MMMTLSVAPGQDYGAAPPVDTRGGREREVGPPVGLQVLQFKRMTLPGMDLVDQRRQ